MPFFGIWMMTWLFSQMTPAEQALATAVTALIASIALAVPVIAFVDCWRRDLAERRRRGESLAVFTSTVVMLGVAAITLFLAISLFSYFSA